MSKSDMGKCPVCDKPFEEDQTIWMLKSTSYHATCILKNKDLLEKWRAAYWHEKEIL